MFSGPQQAKSTEAQTLNPQDCCPGARHHMYPCPEGWELFWWHEGGLHTVRQVGVKILLQWLIWFYIKQI